MTPPLLLCAGCGFCFFLWIGYSLAKKIPREFTTTELQHAQRSRENPAAGQASQVCMQEVELRQTRALSGQSFEPRLGEKDAASGREQQAAQPEAPQSTAKVLTKQEPKDARGHLTRREQSRRYSMVGDVGAKKKKKTVNLSDFSSYRISSCSLVTDSVGLLSL